MWDRPRKSKNGSLKKLTDSSDGHTGHYRTNEEDGIVLGKEAPPFVIVPAIKVTKENLVEGWRESLGIDPPKEIMELYK